MNDEEMVELFDKYYMALLSGISSSDHPSNFGQSGEQVNIAGRLAVDAVARRADHLNKLRSLLQSGKQAQQQRSQQPQYAPQPAAFVQVNPFQQPQSQQPPSQNGGLQYTVTAASSNCLGCGLPLSAPPLNPAAICAENHNYPGKQPPQPMNGLPAHTG